MDDHTQNTGSFQADIASTWLETNVPTTVGAVLQQLERERNLTPRKALDFFGFKSHENYLAYRENKWLLKASAEKNLGAIERAFGRPKGSISGLIRPSVSEALHPLPSDLHGAFCKVIDVTGLRTRPAANAMGISFNQMVAWYNRGTFRVLSAPDALATLERLAFLEPGELTTRWQTHNNTFDIETLPRDFWGAFDVLKEAAGMTTGAVSVAIGQLMNQLGSHRKRGYVFEDAPTVTSKLEQLFLVPQGTLLQRLERAVTPVKLYRLNDALSGAKIADLIAFGRELRTQRGMKPRSIENDIRALEAFLSHLGVPLSAPISPTLDAAFSHLLDGYLRHLSASIGPDPDVAKKALAPIRSRLTMWATNASQLLNSSDLPEDFAGALRSSLKRADLSLHGLYAQIDKKKLSYHTLAYWIDGQVPTFRMIPAVQSIEEALRLQPGTLTSRISKHRAPGSIPRLKTNFGKKMSELVRKPYTLAKMPPRLQREWDMLVAYKTSTYIPPRRNNPCVSDFSNVREHGRWSKRDSGRVESAQIAYQTAIEFFGFLALPKDSEDPMLQGLGMDPASFTLSQMADPELIGRFLDFKVIRSGGLTRGVERLFGMAQGLVHPTWGFLRAQYREFDGGDPAALKSWCDDNYERLKWMSKAKAKSYVMLRDPEDALAGIIDRESPLGALIGLVKSMEADPPPPYWSKQKQASYYRDLILIRLMISHPLRAGNFQRLTYDLTDSSNCHLRRSKNGDWSFNIPPSAFKNERGAAKTPYVMPVDKRLWAHLDDYVKNWRPHLLGASSPYLFLPSAATSPKSADHKKVRKTSTRRRYRKQLPGTFDTNAVYRAIRVRTAQYIPDCQGFGPHAFRHIIATDYLLHNENGHITAAEILHDKVETVIRSYAHLCKRAKLKWFFDHLDVAYGRAA
ncbi:hypothetical protein ACFQX4_18005 [Roseomonas sp. GCM10028921]